ncbi:gluzincin family metallopeptidase [Nocardioides sambongensis]|uniref:hypothetical protein n=1 Tax=Nocardioides sambongensis TaxID=2589074 RepID=UPI00112ECBDC|nr:hypothetical protein [Nocardioides sambongensis]
MRSARAESSRPVRVALGLALVATLTAGCSDSYRPPAPGATTGASPADVEARAVRTLEELQAALRTGDGIAAVAADDRAASAVAAAADNVERADIDKVSLRFLDAGGRPQENGSWDATVELTWRFRGYDRGVARREVTVTMAADGGTVTALGGGEAATPLWLAQPLAVRRVPGALVLAARSTDVTALAARARDAVDQVGAVLGGSGKMVLEAPGSTGALHRALDAPPGTYDTVAAVTAPVDGALTSDAPVHVFLNPAVYPDLDPLAAQVVITHETVHAVTRAPVATAPLWLVEGFADYVALRDVDLPYARSAGQIIDQVAAQGAPRSLPSDAALNPSADGLGAQYEAAWLACVALADHAGEQALIDLYRAVLGGATLDEALDQYTDWTVDDLTAAWRGRLLDLAGAR